MTTEEEIEKLNGRIEKYREAGRQKEVEMYEDQVVLLERQLKKEKEKIKPHPALQFGPISQTVALMACLSLGMSVAPLPREAIAFYILFSRLTIVAVLCLVIHSSIIWYGYNEAIKKLPKPESLDAKLAKMMKSKPDRADLWAHTRSHPSLFLTTRAAAPRLFPFPLGKTRPDATIKDELWWEGGNAPHVGHFNKPKLPEPTGPDEESLMARFKESLAMESQQNLWKKRIRTIQYLCTVIIVSFINSKVAIAGLCWLIYNTVSTELDNMLKPPDDLEPVYKKIDGIVRAAGKTESAPKPAPDQPAGGMSYIYDPISARQVKHHANIPITVVPPHVLMTSENHYYAGVGEQIKDPDK